MTRWMALGAVCLLGCGSSAAAYAPVILQTIEAVAKIAREKTGRDLGQLPTACEQEYNPETGKLLILCEISTK